LIRGSLLTLSVLCQWRTGLSEQAGRCLLQRDILGMGAMAASRQTHHMPRHALRTPGRCLCQL
jgi:hypothetical protein